MAHPISVTARFGVAAITIALFNAVPTAAVHAFPLSRAAWPIFTAAVEIAKAPPGWTEFCLRYAPECDVKATTPRNVALTPEVRQAMVDVNNWVNAHIKPTPDMKHWGRINKWYYAEDGRGDCKDYVLVKRRKLMEAGLPREALLITIVWTRQDQGHAVLIVRTSKGDYVLDNLSSHVMLWSQTNYDFVKRQSLSNPNAWVYIDGNPRKQPVTAASGIDGDPPKQPVTAANGVD